MCLGAWIANTCSNFLHQFLIVIKSQHKRMKLVLTSPATRVQMVHPVQQPPDPLDHMRSGAGTMPRLSSSSMRSTASSQGSAAPPGGMQDMYGKLQSNTLGRPPPHHQQQQHAQFARQNTPPGSLGGTSSRHSNTPPAAQQVI